MSGAYDGESRDVLDSLEAYVREGARRMLAAALEEEVTGFLGRGRYERGKPYRGYRNGHHPARQLTVGVGAVGVRVPRVADVPAEVAPEGFQSQVVQRYQGRLGYGPGRSLTRCPACLADRLRTR